MCGIIGFAGDVNSASSVLLRGLQALEYRGYDSAGIALVQNNEIIVLKSKGKVSELAKLVADFPIPSTIGIGHTRWATHGVPSAINAHPHRVGNVTLVHNGIIENYEELRKTLQRKGYAFVSQTDTEVCAALIDLCTKESKSKREGLFQAYQMMHGSFALAILFEDEMDQLYAMRKDSPLVVAKTNDAGYIASDISAIVEYSSEYYILDHDEIACLSKNAVSFYDRSCNSIDKQSITTSLSAEEIHKQGYDHYMLKEIHEQPEVIRSILQHYVSNGEANTIINMPDFAKYSQIHIVGCGSAMYAGMIAKRLIESLARIPVYVEIASEYRYLNPILTKDTLVIAVSQSGETADTLAALRHVKSQGIDTLGVVNVIDSSIAMEADRTCMILAKKEISVATTKAFLAQIMVLALIALNISLSKKQINEEEVSEILKQAYALPEMLSKVLREMDLKDIAKDLYMNNDVFYIGRGIDYALCMEASLKLKEIGYIHSEAYGAGELKHGSIALIAKNTPVIAIMSDEELSRKTLSNIEEVRARGADVYLVTTKKIASSINTTKHMIVVPETHTALQPVMMMIPLQLLAYEVALLRGCEIDQPRNLAKSVTVE